LILVRRSRPRRHHDDPGRLRQGALNQSSRNALRGGQKGQTRPGLPDASGKAARLILEIVVVIESGAGTCPLRCR